MKISLLERELVCGDYTCDVYSHGGTYGFVVYTVHNDGRKLVSFDFGYDGIETAESVALAGILRCMVGVCVKDYTTVYNDSKSDSEKSECEKCSR